MEYENRKELTDFLKENLRIKVRKDYASGRTPCGDHFAKTVIIIGLYLDGKKIDEDWININ